MTSIRAVTEAATTLVKKTYEKDLLECKWKSISFPITSLRTDLKQDLVEHRYPDRDGAHVESTGRAPLHVSAKALFYNNISPGTGETWKFGNLFPIAYKQFIEVCKDRGVGTLQHPFLGSFDAKLVSMETELDSSRRDGVIVSLEWVETIKIETFEEMVTVEKAAVSTKAQEVVDAFNEVPKGIPIDRSILENKMDLLEAIDKLKAIIDSATLIGMKALGQIDRIMYHLNNLMFSINRVNDVLLANLKGKIEALRATLNAMRSQQQSNLAKTLGDMRFYIVPKDTTIGFLAAALNNSVIDLIKLNPQIASQPVIKRLTPIRYMFNGEITAPRALSTPTVNRTVAKPSVRK